MTKKNLIHVIGALLILGTFPEDIFAADYIPPTAKITIQVLDENQRPIEGANVTISFRNRRTEMYEFAKGLTDKQGLYSAEGAARSGPLNCEITKEGYYEGGTPTPFFRDVENERWLPWNATCTAVLRKIGNPVSVYARSGWITVPQLNKPCGYDLIAGDWVAPWGKGTVGDFIFTAHCEYTNFAHFGVLMDLSFSNPADGIQVTVLPKKYAHSWFEWPREAPEEGYQPTWHSELVMPDIGYRDMTFNESVTHRKGYRGTDIIAEKFYFRIRTVMKDGKIVSALYGKLAEGFQISKNSDGKACLIHLRYYLNPVSLDRNMEFDPNKNLLRKLGRDDDPIRTP
jgi:hypothetical protein